MQVRRRVEQALRADWTAYLPRAATPGQCMRIARYSASASGVGHRRVHFHARVRTPATAHVMAWHGPPKMGRERGARRKIGHDDAAKTNHAGTFAIFH